MEIGSRLLKSSSKCSLVDQRIFWQELVLLEYIINKAHNLYLNFNNVYSVWKPKLFVQWVTFARQTYIFNNMVRNWQ